MNMRATLPLATLDAISRPYPATTQLAAMDEFHRLRLEAARLLREASQLPAIADHWKAQASCAARIAERRFHRIVGSADGPDFLAVRDDIQYVAANVDAFLLALGDECACNTHGLDISMFEDQLSGAIQGNATYVLEEAAERADEEAAEERP